MSLTFRQRVRKFAFHLATRVPLWTIHGVNRHIAKHTRDQPWHEGSSFPWARELEGRYDELREEISQALQRLAHLPTLQEILPTTELYAFPDDWRQVMLYTYGKRIDDNCAQYPKTAEAIEKIPGVVSSTLSILGPGEHIPPHEHHYKGLLIYHFGIIIPKEGRCEMRVGEEWRRWQEGKLVAIDPTFDHEVYNETDQYRIVLIGQFRRPDMPPVMRFLDGVYLGLMNATPMGRNMVRQVRARAAEQRAEIEAAMAASAKPTA